MCGPCLFYTGSLTSKSFKWRKERPSECELCPPAFFTVKMPLLCRDLGMEKTFKQLCFARARCKLEIGKYLSILREWSTFMFFPTSYSVSLRSKGKYTKCLHISHLGAKQGRQSVLVFIFKGSTYFLINCSTSWGAINLDCFFCLVCFPLQDFIKR